MDTETPEVKGWRSFKFRFGSDAEVCERIDAFINDILPRSESIGSGCYHTVVDEDELDSH